MTKRELQRLVGQNIKTERERRHLTRDKMSDLVGLTPNFIAQLEGGYRAPSIESLRAIALGLNVSTDSILFGLDRNNSACADILSLFSCLSNEDCRKMQAVMYTIMDQFIRDKLNPPAIDNNTP